MSFKIGDRVEKYTGAYTTFGEVRSAYTTRGGAVRYVVEVEPQGFQMIWSDNELRAACPTGSTQCRDVVINGDTFRLPYGYRLDYVGVCELADLRGYPTFTWSDEHASGVLGPGGTLYVTGNLRLTCVHTGAA